MKERMLKMVHTVLKNEAPSRNQQLTGKVLSALRSFTSNYEQVALSPDAKLVAFSIKSSDWKPQMPGSHESRFLPNGVPQRFGGAEVWITDMNGAHIRVLTPGWCSSWGSSWSPDGRKLAFYSDKNGIPQIWIWHRETGEMQLACHEPVCVWMGTDRIIWHPEGTRLIAKLQTDGWAPPSKKPESVGKPREVWNSLKKNTGS